MKQSESQRRAVPRILIGFMDIASYYSGLQQGLRELGVDCLFLNLEPTVITRGETSGSDSFVIKLVKSHIKKLGSPPNNRWARRFLFRIQDPIVRAILLI